MYINVCICHYAYVFVYTNICLYMIYVNFQRGTFFALCCQISGWVRKYSRYQSKNSKRTLKKDQITKVLRNPKFIWINPHINKYKRLFVRQSKAKTVEVWKVDKRHVDKNTET